MAFPEPARFRAAWNSLPLTPFLWLGLLAFTLPTMFDIARVSWSTEQGGHGPIVLATGIWLVTREFGAMRAVVRPGSLAITLAVLIPALMVFTLARITGIVEVEGFAMYIALIATAYSLWGGAALRRIWFPLVYLAFTFPPPDTIVALITQPLKIAISVWAVWLLHLFNYPIASSGVTLQIGQYQLLVAAACAGINSLISLTALGLFYSYVRHQSHPLYMLVLIALIIPIAILVNLIRVLLLLLITYYFGEAAGQGFFHDLAGITMFLLALSFIFVLDWIGMSLRNRFTKSKVLA